jgi:hypothetical protein
VGTPFLPAFNPTIHPIDTQQSARPTARAPDGERVGIDFFQVLAVARERGGYGVARTRAFEQDDMRKRLGVIVSLIVHDNQHRASTAYGQYREGGKVANTTD